MGGLFQVPTRPGKNNDVSVAKKLKSKNKTTASVKGGGSLLDKISTIKAMVEKYLGKDRDLYTIIQTVEHLDEYITQCLNNKVIAIDTETTGLDPLLDELVGICIYTPGQKAAYIPINHISYVTSLRASNQLSIEEVKFQFQRLEVSTDLEVIEFNAKFDTRFLRSGLGVNIKCTWDAYLASRLLNENEPSKGLKPLHKKYVLDGKGDAFSFDELFKGVPFNLIPIDTAYLYAAKDPLITYELYEFQKPFFTVDNEECISRNLQDVAWVFFNIEMPLVQVVCDMEDNGITFDTDYANKLSIKYNQMLEEKKADCYKILAEDKELIDEFIKHNPQCKLDNPINIASPSQLSTYLYDILKVPAQDKKSPRGTGADILEKIGLPICKAILDYRTLEKLVSTYIDKLPECVNPKDGRIHCSFNQYGADTGRFSSSDPNLQNIPSHNKDIRKMFVASDGYVLMSSDFSQQEPKCLAALCNKAGDSQMYDTFMEGKDLYAEIASLSFNTSYDNCLEFRPDGTTNPEGKNRRSQAKSILLGVLYGRGVPSIAEQLGTSTQKAQAIKDSVFRGFPAIEEFENDSLTMARELGYVTTVCGRKRRLPDMQLNEFDFSWKDGVSPYTDPLDFDNEEESSEVPYDIIDDYLERLSKAYFTQKRKIIEDALTKGIKISDNGGKIADAQRQCVNSRIQGSAADLTKLAMIDLNSNKKLKELGFRLLIPVHDEVIAECPIENAKECSTLLAQVMSEAAEKILKMPIKCDVEITKAWYGESVVL